MRAIKKKKNYYMEHNNTRTTRRGTPVRGGHPVRGGGTPFRGGTRGPVSDATVRQLPSRSIGNAPASKEITARSSEHSKAPEALQALERFTGCSPIFTEFFGLSWEVDQ